MIANLTLLNFLKDYNKKRPFFKDYLVILLLMIGLPFLFISCKSKTHPNQSMIDLLKEAETNYNSPDNVFSPDAVVIYCDPILKNSSDEN